MSTEETKYLFTWNIENLSLCTQKKYEFLRSPIFKIGNLHESYWFVGLYPRGGKKSDEGFMGCSLHRSADHGPPEIECDFKFEILDTKGNIIFSQGTSAKFKKGDNWGWRNFLKNSMLLGDNRYSDDFLVVKCEVTSKKQNELYPSCSEFSGLTKVHFDQYSFRWIVKNSISDLPQVKEIPYTETSQIRIEVLVSEDDIKVLIHRIKGPTESQSVRCRISLIDVAGIKRDSQDSMHFFEDGVRNDTWQFPTFLKRSKLNSESEKYLKNDCFVLQFEMKLSRGTQSYSIEYRYCAASICEDPPCEDAFTILRRDMEKLYLNKIHADVKLHVGDKTILAHKSILSIRSPVFSAMFDSEMTENETGSVDIPDLEAGTVNSLLKFMYTGAVDNLTHEIALKLLMAADKYQVLSLKEKCADFLKSAVCDANVCDVLVVSDLVQHEALQDVCVDYIKHNSECIFFSDEWKLVIENNLQLAMKTVTKVSQLLVTGQKKNDGN